MRKNTVLYSMNYLAHAYLSFEHPGLLTGNMIADHVKGNIDATALPEAIRRGVRLHRRIDEFTDRHPATQRAKIWFREDYHLYAGPILDCLYDHFLANDPRHFTSEAALRQFTLDTYRQLEAYSDHFPDGFAAYFPYMREHNWLFNYRNLGGMQKSLNGLCRRARFMPAADKAYELFITHYYALNQSYFELMDDLVPFVKREISIGES